MSRCIFRFCQKDFARSGGMAREKSKNQKSYAKKIMKRSIYWFIVLVGVLMVSCGKSKENTTTDNTMSELEEFVKEYNYMCPYSNAAGVVKSVTLVDKNVIIQTEVGESGEDYFNAMRQNEETVKNLFLIAGRYGEPETGMRKLFSLISEVKGGIVLEYQSAISHESCKITLDSNEISAAVKAGKSTALELLNTLIDWFDIGGATEMLPGLNFEKMSIEDNYLVLQISYDESQIDLYQSISSVKGAFYDEARSANLGIKYIFQNSKTGKKKVVTVEHAEL